MNRQTLTIGAVLLAVVVVALGTAVYLNRGGSDDGTAEITGPGRAAEARGIIADLESRREGAETPAPRPAPALIGSGDEQGGDDSEPVAGGAIAVTPEPAASEPTGADAELDAAFERARELQQAGQLDDAQVLFFFGARQGHAGSAFAYAEMNDPLHHSPETSLLAEPDAFQAFRWYSAARDGGLDDAAARLDALRTWAEGEAEAGNLEAEQLLLQWEQ
jgi:hypothetical protein